MSQFDGGSNEKNVGWLEVTGSDLESRCLGRGLPRSNEIWRNNIMSRPSRIQRRYPINPDSL